MYKLLCLLLLVKILIYDVVIFNYVFLLPRLNTV